MTSAEAVAWVRQHGRVQRGQRYPREVVAAVAAHVREQRALGVSWEALQRQTGLGCAPLKRWAETMTEAGVVESPADSRVRPVRVEVRGPAVVGVASTPALQIRLPGGAVIEGLSVGDVQTLLLGLSA